jgi:peptide/nickel transport system permease protein
VLGFVLRRIAWAAMLLVVVTFVSYVLFFIAPVEGLSVEGAFSDQRRANDSGSREFAVEQSSALGDYLGFLGHLVRGDMGTAFRGGDEVSDMVFKALPATGSLVLGGLVFWILFALSVGVYSAMHPRSLIDRFGTAFVLAGICAHPIWLGLVLAWTFGFKLGWFPIEGYCDFFRPNAAAECGGPVQWAYHLVLPWFVLGASFAALYTRMIRAGLMEAMQEDYVRTARAKGLSEWTAMRRHAFRNSLLPVVSMITMDIGIAFGATLFVEYVFRIPGLGLLTVTAIPRRDLPIILGVIIVVSVIVVLVNLLVDLIYAFVDPRISSPTRRRERVAQEAPARQEPRPAPAQAQ